MQQARLMLILPDFKERYVYRGKHGCQGKCTQTMRAGFKDARCLAGRAHQGIMQNPCSQWIKAPSRTTSVTQTPAAISVAMIIGLACNTLLTVACVIAIPAALSALPAVTVALVTATPAKSSLPAT